MLKISFLTTSSHQKHEKCTRNRSDVSNHVSLQESWRSLKPNLRKNLLPFALPKRKNNSCTCTDCSRFALFHCLTAFLTFLTNALPSLESDCVWHLRRRHKPIVQPLQSNRNSQKNCSSIRHDTIENSVTFSATQHNSPERRRISSRWFFRTCKYFERILSCSGIFICFINVCSASFTEHLFQRTRSEYCTAYSDVRLVE